MTRPVALLWTRWGVALAAICVASASQSQDKSQQELSALEKLRNDYQTQLEVWSAKYTGRQGTPDAELIERYDAWPGWAVLPRIVKLATSDPTSPDAFETLKWFVELSDAVGAADQAYLLYGAQVVRELQARHLATPRIIELYDNCSRYPTPPNESLLRECLERGSTRRVRGLACFHLAEGLRNKGRLAFEFLSGRFERGTDFERHVRDRWSPAFVAFARSADADEALAEAKSLEDRVLDEFDDVEALRESPFAQGKTTLGFWVRLQRAQAIAPVLGQPAPEVASTDFDERPSKLSDFKGQVVLLHFWATWYPRSIERIALLQKLSEQHGPDRLRLLGINFDRDREGARNFVKEHNLAWPSWWASDLGDAIGLLSPSRGLPDNVLIDHRGLLRFRNLSGDALEQAVATLLAERAADPAGPP